LYRVGAAHRAGVSANYIEVRRSKPLAMAKPKHKRWLNIVMLCWDSDGTRIADSDGLEVK
jgi:hypothetical protein